MRVLTQYKLSRMTRTELNAMLRSIAEQLPRLPAESAELRTAHTNLQNIRWALTLPQPGFGPRL